MAILQTDASGIALTNNSGKVLVRTSGSILQVQSNVSTAANSTTSTSFVNSALAVNITPYYTTSKILIITSFFTWIESYGGGQIYDTAYFSIAKYSSAFTGRIAPGTDANGFTNFTSSSGNFVGAVPGAISYLDTSNNTTNIQYILQFRSRFGGTVSVINGTGSEGKTSTITAIEISA
jgi:hypothetical protein